MFLSDVIAAVSTPRGKGGVAVIRISGDCTLDVVEKVFRPVGGRSVDSYPARHAIYGGIVAPDGSEVDRGILTVFRGPASYTGEDMAEVSCHGGVYVTREVLSCILSPTILAMALTALGAYRFEHKDLK